GGVVGCVWGVNRLHTENGIFVKKKQTKKQKHWSRLDRAYSTNKKPGKNQQRTRRSEQRNSDMTNAVYSCWCFDGARVGGEVGWKRGKTGGPVICRRRVF
uniref:Uncharacterized protein n=1 Tax=Gasterosteus aculeatus TaxID=69293 RepID=G3PGG2_GASAC